MVGCVSTASRTFHHDLPRPDLVVQCLGTRDSGDWDPGDLCVPAVGAGLSLDQPDP
jgi:hypothetical protein